MTQAANNESGDIKVSASTVGPTSQIAADCEERERHTERGRERETERERHRETERETERERADVVGKTQKVLLMKSHGGGEMKRRREHSRLKGRREEHSRPTTPLSFRLHLQPVFRAASSSTLGCTL